MLAQLALELDDDVDFHRSGVKAQTAPWVSSRHGHVWERAHATKPVGTEVGGQSSLCLFQSKVGGVGRQASWHCGRWAKRPAPGSRDRST